MATKGDATKLAAAADGEGAHAPAGAKAGAGSRRKKNYLLRPQYRQVNLKYLSSLSEEAALKLLHQIRWSHCGEGKQSCPKCGAVDEHYVCPSIEGFKCRSCKRHSRFSPEPDSTARR